MEVAGESKASDSPMTGVEREALLLTPVEVDHGKAAFRTILPGVM